MTLSPGSRLGPYEILGLIGAGGMGEVYQATDTRLGRTVAIKILPPHLTDPEHRARFEREAKAIAALAHPHICSLYDVGEHAGAMFLVMEHLAGETLAERLAKGPLRPDQAVEFGAQIAEALSAAHRAAIIHRDLKPGNIMLTRSGVKLLDFGLAKRAAPGSAATLASGFTASVTRDAITGRGVIVGTLHYMAPEQLRGQEEDARTDLWALGLVLFEMVTGRRAFEAPSGAELMAAILERDPPPLSNLQCLVPRTLEQIVERCLAKSQDGRPDTAHDVALMLTAVMHAEQSAARQTPIRARRLNRTAIGAFAAVAIGALAMAVWIGRILKPLPPAVTFEPRTWEQQWITSARFGPDGQTIVYSAAPTGHTPRLFIIRPGSAVSEPIGEPGVQLLSVSSKGELLVLSGAHREFHRVFRGTLSRMNVDGAARPLMQEITDADWAPDGSALAIARRQDGRSTIEYPAGQVVYRQPTGYLSDLRVSPDGSLVAFFHHEFPGDNRGDLLVVDRTGTVTTLTDEFWSIEGLSWCADGRALFFSASRQGGDAHQPWIVDVNARTPPRPAMTTPGSFSVLDVARNGRTLGLRDDLRRRVRALVPGQTTEQEFGRLDLAIGGRLSSDRRWLVFTDLSASANYSVTAQALDTRKAVSLGEGMAGPVSPDDHWVLALVPSSGDTVLYPTGAGEPVTLPRGPIVSYIGLTQGALPYAQWFPDSRRVLLCGSERGKPGRCYEQSVASGLPRPITPEGVTGALLDPTGRGVLLRTTTGTYATMVLGTAEAKTVNGIAAGDYPVEVAPDLRTAVVSTPDVPTRVVRVDLATGTAAAIAELAPPDRGGVTRVVATQWIDGGRGYVYSYSRQTSRLFVVANARQ